MLICGFDLETTGLNTETDSIIEIGAVLWDTDLNTPMRIFSSLVYVPEGTVISDEAASVNGITREMLTLHGISAWAAIKEVRNLIALSDYIVGHNIRSFDEPMLKQGFLREHVAWINKPLIDTMTDLPFPKKIKGRTLIGLTAEHGFLNPFPHRAVTDVLASLKLLSCYPLAEVLRIANSPFLYIAADVPFQRKDEAKKLGYRWHGNQRFWWKQIRDFQLAEEQLVATFVVNVLSNPVTDE